MLLSKDQKGKVIFYGRSQLQEKKKQKILRRNPVYRETPFYMHSCPTMQKLSNLYSVCRVPMSVIKGEKLYIM